MNNKIEKVDTRSVIAVLWTLACIYFIGYIIRYHGKEKEILTLIIGLISGTILGSILGTYFSAQVSKELKHPPTIIPPDAQIQNVTTEDISGNVKTENLTVTEKPKEE